MNFCILIELSRESISFLYNRSDSENGFVPFVEQSPLPLAIYCSGNQIEIGQFAVDEANKHNPNAFVDIFRKMRHGGTFKYRGEEIPNNMLLYNAILRYLSLFFDSTLIGQKGRLDDNIASMPICFLFSADIEENERLFVKDSFRKSGFANVGIRDCDQLAMRTLHPKSAYCICVTSNGQDLFVNVYDNEGKLSETKTIRGKGRDPRMGVAVDKLWDSIGYDNYYLNRESEEPILEQIAEDFLGSGQLSLCENVILSDGQSHEVSLNLNELEQYSVKEDGKIINDILRSLSEKGIKPSVCTIILQGKAAQNSFFSNIFKKEFDTVVSIDRAKRADMLATFLEDVKACGYIFEKDKNRQEGQETSSSVKVVHDPDPRDKRDFKILKLSVGTCLVNGKLEQAQEDIKAFTQRMHDNGIRSFDDELEELSKQLLKSETSVQVPSPPPPTADVPPTPRDERDMKMLRMEIATYVRNGETKKVKPSVQAFRQEMHAKGVHSFDEELDVLEKGERSPNSNTHKKAVQATKKTEDTTVKRVKTARQTASLIDEGTNLMRSEKFKEARDWFRANNQPNKADDCTTLIRMLRFVPVYESELSTTIETKNKDKVRARVKEIKSIISLYTKYGMDASALKKLIEEYRRVN